MPKTIDRQRLFKPFVGLTTACALAALLYSAITLPVARLDVPFLLLALITIVLSSRMTIVIPRVKGHISVSDTFIFITMLLYGGSAAIILSAAEALCSSFRFSRKPITILFNCSALACSTFITVQVLRLCFGRIIDIGHFSDSAFISAVCLMALVQYASNSWIVAIGVALKTGEPILSTWRKGYLWTSITYFAGASAAGIIAKMIGAVGFYALLVTAPIIAIIYFTYKTYLQNVETIGAQAELAERHVAELNHYIAEQERIREQYSQLEKMSALGELASGVAHDFNNTLAGILARAQLLQRSNDLEKIKRGLQIIIQSAEDGAKTVKRIQDFARQRRDHDLELVAVDQLIQDIAEITRPRWKDNAEAGNVFIKLNLQANSHAYVMGDASELREVLVNMVFNAVDAMPQGGQLTLSAATEGEEVIICVGDTGLGMSEEVRSRVFDPFFTTKGKAGMGLGLAVSYGIIHRHKGTIEVESEINCGTTFRLTMPTAKVALPATMTESPPPPQQHADESQLQQETISAKFLVVDDEESVRKLLRDILESEGHEAVTAESGHEGLLLFEKGDFDAVFTDVGMPGMSGWEMARAIRASGSTVPIAVITGWGEAVGSQDQKEAQVDWVVTKPFTTDRILELAGEAAARRSEANLGNFCALTTTQLTSKAHAVHPALR